MSQRQLVAIVIAVVVIVTTIAAIIRQLRPSPLTTAKSIVTFV